MRIICRALVDSLSHNCVLMILYVNFLPLDVVGIYVKSLMYADDLIYIMIYV